MPPLITYMQSFKKLGFVLIYVLQFFNVSWSDIPFSSMKTSHSLLYHALYDTCNMRGTHLNKLFTSYNSNFKVLKFAFTFYYYMVIANYFGIILPVFVGSRAQKLKGIIHNLHKTMTLQNIIQNLSMQFMYNQKRVSTMSRK